MTPEADQPEPAAVPPDPVAMRRHIIQIVAVKQFIPAIAALYPGKELAAIAAAGDLPIEELREAVAIVGETQLALLAAVRAIPSKELEALGEALPSIIGNAQAAVAALRAIDETIPKPAAG